MNCDTANDRLLDLLYEELEGPEADETRAHVEQCASCRASYRKLGLTQRLLSALPEEEPDRSLDAKILAAARQKVGAEPERGKEESGRDDEGGGLWGAILRWLSGFAASPQFVMASIMMLVVAIGVWYLPAARRQPEASGGTVVHPDHQGEAAPSATLVPAEPLELDLDRRTGRLRSRDGEGAAETLVQPSPEEGRVAAAQRSNRAARRADREPAGEVREGEIDALADEAPAMEMQLAQGDSIGGTERAQAPRARRSATGSAFASGGAAPADDRSMEEAERSEASAPAQAYRPAPAPAGAPPSTAGSGADYGGEGVARNTMQETVPSSIHGRARSYAQNDSCEAAVRQYQDLMRRFPTYSRRAQAMIEMAECYRRMGRLDQARTTLLAVERGYTQSAPEARRRRYHVEQMQRARRAAPAQVDEAAAAEPASAY